MRLISGFLDKVRKTFLGLTILELLFFLPCSLCFGEEALPVPFPSVSPGLSAGGNKVVIEGHVFEFESLSKFVLENWTGLQADDLIATSYDFDRDGTSDLVTVDESGSSIRIYRARPDQRFVMSRTIRTPWTLKPEGLLVGEFLEKGIPVILLWSKDKDTFALGRLEPEKEISWKTELISTEGQFPERVFRLYLHNRPADSVLACGNRPQHWAIIRGALAAGTLYDSAGMAFCRLSPNKIDALGAADIDGVGSDLALQATAVGEPYRFMLESVNLASATVRPLLPFDPHFRWNAVYVGDFDGDARDDVLLRMDELMSPWWIGLSDGKNYFPLPLPAGAIGHPQDNDRVVVGDFNGDGLSDILRQGSEQILSLSRSAVSRPRPGVRVSLLNQSVKTGRDGKFRFEVLLNAPAVLEIEDPENEYFRTSLKLLPHLLTRTRLSFSGRPKGRNVGAAMSRYSKQSGPYVCLGFNPEKDIVFRMTFQTVGTCGKDYGVYSADNGRVRMFSCCRLPSEDIFSEEIIQVPQADCPENFVLTGGIEVYPKPEVPLYECRKINLSRYRLGPRKRGAYFGEGWHMKDVQKRFLRSELPLAVRYGVGRNSIFTWNRDGCIGRTVGSLISAILGDDCDEQIYQELLYSGKDGDPPAGTPVKMFPDCERLLNVNDPDLGCVPEQKPATER